MGWKKNAQLIVLRTKVIQVGMEGQYDYTRKDFAYNNFTYNINKCNIAYMFFIYCYV